MHLFVLLIEQFIIQILGVHQTINEMCYVISFYVTNDYKLALIQSKP